MKIPKLNTESHWISLSDMMTGLMIIFLFVAVSYMSKIQKTQTAVDNLTKNYLEKRKAIEAALREIISEFDTTAVKLGDDLNVKFQKPEICFAPNSGEIRPEFGQQLNKFIPKFLNLITNPAYKNTISEVRIEGHTADPQGVNRGTYEGGFPLAQERARNVLLFALRNNSFQKYNTEETQRLRYLFNATGFSCGRIIDNEGKTVFQSKKQPNHDISRRVEFKIVTTSENLVNEIVNLQNK
jgi:outer membrane protein OmpA-like peptidoglycan-associated protein